MVRFSVLGVLALVATASAAGLSERCEDKLDCSGALRCIAKKCLPISEVGGPCDRNVDCSGSTVCIKDVCGPQSEVGGECDSNFDCKDGRCVSGECVPRSPPGGACDSKLDCQYGECTKGECVGDPVSSAPNTISVEGGVCEDADDCDEAFRCVGSVCVQPGKAGEKCGINIDCIEELVCIANKCVIKSALGGPCENNFDCDSKTRCVRKVCAPRSALGGPCDTPLDCVDSQPCIIDTCSASLSEVDGPCSEDDQCNKSSCDTESMKCVSGTSATTTGDSSADGGGATTAGSSDTAGDSGTEGGSANQAAETDDGSTCVDHQWLVAQGFGAHEMVHAAPVLAPVLCPVGSRLPCGTAHHALRIGNQDTSYGEYCATRKVECTRERIFVNSLFAFHPVSRSGIDLTANTLSVRLYMHDVRYPFGAQVALHMAISASHNAMHTVRSLVTTRSAA